MGSGDGISDVDGYVWYRKEEIYRGNNSWCETCRRCEICWWIEDLRQDCGCWRLLYENPWKLHMNQALNMHRLQLANPQYDRRVLPNRPSVWNTSGVRCVFTKVTKQTYVLLYKWDQLMPQTPVDSTSKTMLNKGSMNKFASQKPVTTVSSFAAEENHTWCRPCMRLRFQCSCVKINLSGVPRVHPSTFGSRIGYLSHAQQHFSYTKAIWYGLRTPSQLDHDNGFALEDWW